MTDMHYVQRADFAVAVAKLDARIRFLTCEVQALKESLANTEAKAENMRLQASCEAQHNPGRSM